MERVGEASEGVRSLGFGGALARQMALLWSTRRPILLAIGLLGLLGISGEPWTENQLARLLTPWPAWLILVGPIWGLAVWHNEGPSARHYFWSQPVGRTVHTLSRVAAGALWLWLLYAFLILAAIVLGTVDGDVGQLGLMTFSGWVNLFTAPLLGYLIVSALAVASDHPVRWLLGVLFLVPLMLSLVSEWLGQEQVVEWLLTPLAHQEWGLGVTLVGAFGDGMVGVITQVQERASAHAAPSAGARWWAVTALWLAFWAAVVVALATRHPDTLPRWRRPG